MKNGHLAKQFFFDLDHFRMDSNQGFDRPSGQARAIVLLNQVVTLRAGCPVAQAFACHGISNVGQERLRWVSPPDFRAGTEIANAGHVMGPPLRCEKPSAGRSTASRKVIFALEGQIIGIHPVCAFGLASASIGASPRVPQCRLLLVI